MLSISLSQFILKGQIPIEHCNIFLYHIFVTDKFHRQTAQRPEAFFPDSNEEIIPYYLIGRILRRSFNRFNGRVFTTHSGQSNVSFLLPMIYPDPILRSKVFESHLLS